jgi:hypothetical protein
VQAGFRIDQAQLELTAIHRSPNAFIDKHGAAVVVKVGRRNIVARYVRELDQDAPAWPSREVAFIPTAPALARRRSRPRAQSAREDFFRCARASSPDS